MRVLGSPAYVLQAPCQTQNACRKIQIIQLDQSVRAAQYRAVNALGCFIVGLGGAVPKIHRNLQSSPRKKAEERCQNPRNKKFIHINH
jgi:hypothetical protein